MGELEDIDRLRNDIADLYEQQRAVQQRLTRLEERSDNRDEKIEELKQSLKELHAQIKTMEEAIECRLSQIAANVQTIANAPATKLAGRWEEAIKAFLALAVGALFAWLIKGAL